MMLLKFLVMFSLSTVVWSQLDDGSLDAFSDSLFSSVCPSEAQLSNWSKCIWPHGDLRRVLDLFIKDAGEKNCKTPPKAMIKEALNAVRKSNITTHPLYRRIPRESCGFCSRKARCCSTSRSFLMQSFKSESCETTIPPCTVEKIDDVLVERLKPFYPEVTFNGNRCDFMQYTDQNMIRLRADRAIKIVKPLMCQLLGTSDPKINCVTVGDQCKCCCYQYNYADGECVPNANFVDNSCTRH